jgi:putative Mg2+ transporter-C (MgtC) family protein
MVPSPWCETISVFAAFLCGAIVGFEREKGHKAAGLRTQILICVGSAVFTVASMSGPLNGHEPGRIAAQIVTGVGFLGAGSILRDRQQIVGLTTAATIWTVSAIGIVVGAGYVTVGILLSVGVLIVLGSFRQIETLLGGRCNIAHTTVVYRPERGKTRALIGGMLDESHGRARVVEEKGLPDGTLAMHIEYCSRHREHRAVLALLAAMPAVEALEEAQGDD